MVQGSPFEGHFHDVPFYFIVFFVHVDQVDTNLYEVFQMQVSYLKAACAIS